MPNRSNKHTFGSLRVGVACGTVAHTAEEAAALYDDVHMGGHIEFDAATEGVDVYLLVLGDHGLAQVHADAAAESVETGTVEGLATKYILVAAVAHRAADTLAVLADGQRALQPLVRVSSIAVDDGLCTHIQQQGRGHIRRPRLAPQPLVLNQSPHVGQFP